MANIDWPGLLKWSTKHHDGTAPSNFKPLSQEDKDWLEAALADAFGKVEDPNKIMQEAIQKLGDSSCDILMTALEAIDQCCDYPDCPRNLEKLDGVQPMLDLLEHESAVVAARSAELLAIMLPSNDHIQHVAVKRGAFDKIAKAITRPEVRTNALGVLAAVVRNEEAIEKEFAANTALFNAVVAFCKADETMRTRQKVASLMRHMLTFKRVSSEQTQAIAAGAVELLSLDVGEVQYGEVVAGLVEVLLDESVPAAVVRMYETSLKAAVKTRVGALKGQEGVETEVATLRKFA